MQDAHQNISLLVLRVVVILALGLTPLFSPAADNNLIPMACEGASCVPPTDTQGDTGQDGEAPGATRPYEDERYPSLDPSGIPGFTGFVHCASFPVLPQAPPVS